MSKFPEEALRGRFSSPRDPLHSEIKLTALLRLQAFLPKLESQWLLWRYRDPTQRLLSEPRAIRKEKQAPNLGTVLKVSGDV